MTAHTRIPPTLADAIDLVAAHGTENQQQDIRKAKRLFEIFGSTGASLHTTPADLVEFEAACPKYHKSRGPLLRLVAEAGISAETYKQCWRAARRIIDAASVSSAAVADCQNADAPDDAWDDLLARMDSLRRVGLVGPMAHLTIGPLVAVGRSIGCAPGALTPEVMAPLIKAASTSDRKKLRRACKAFDSLLSVPAVLECPSPVLISPAPRQLLPAIPRQIETEIEAWIDISAREQLDPEFAMHAQPNSRGSRGVYRAALRAYVVTAQEMGISSQGGLSSLLDKSTIERVVSEWIASKVREERTHYSYVITLASAFSRNGHVAAAGSIHKLLNNMRPLRAGRQKAQTMSPKVKAWCRNLINEPKAARRFLTQHVDYWRHAAEALESARQAGFDLQVLADPARMSKLPRVSRSAARKLLQRARSFGTLAAYSAIAIEGAPFRRGNMLTLRCSGARRTFHNHLAQRQPYVVIKLPVEELKNCKYLLARGEVLEPVEIRTRSAGSCATDILKWYFQEIRPLFPLAKFSDCLFPPISHVRSADAGLGVGAFDTWMTECSASIGLPMSSHNYRHGHCTLYLNEKRGSVEDLARLLGDSPETIRRFYGWIDARQSMVRVQDDIAGRLGKFMPKGDRP